MAEKNFNSWYTFKNGVTVFNSTPHTINIQDMDGEVIGILPNPDFLINARAVEVPAGNMFVKTSFVGDDAGRATIQRIIDFFHSEVRANGPKVIVGSIIAAQAYPGVVVAMCPVSGYERVAPNEKRMRCDKFTTFAE